MRRDAFSVVLGSLTALGTSARAAVAAGEPAASRLPDTMPTDRDAIMELLSRLTDADVRELLRRQIEHGIAGHQSEAGPAAESVSLVGSFDHAVGLVRDRLGEMLSAWLQLPSIVTGVQDWLSAGRSVWQPAGRDSFRDGNARRGIPCRAARPSLGGQACSRPIRPSAISSVPLSRRGAG